MATKTAIITCEFTYDFSIGQLTERDVNLVEETTGIKGWQYIDFAEFYRLSPDFQCEVLTPEKCFQLNHEVEDMLHAKLLKNVAKHLMSECRTNTTTANVQVPNCPDKVFMYSDGGVYLVVRATCLIKLPIDKSQKIDERALRKVIDNNCGARCFNGEPLQRLNEVQNGELEIEYR